MNENFGPDFRPLAQTLMKGVLESITPHLRPLQAWINSFTSSKNAVVGDRLEKRLEKLERNTPLQKETIFPLCPR